MVIRNETGVQIDETGSIPTLPHDSEGNPIGVQYPLSTDGDSIYPKDINVALSDIGTFDDGSTDITDLFKDIPIELEDNSSTNPKYFEFVLNRPVEATQVALGCASGDFSNVSIEVKDLSGTTRGTGGDPTDNTKRSSFEYDLINSGDVSRSVKFGAVRIEFHTPDPVCVGFVFIQKDTRVIARLQGVDQDGIVRGIRSTEVGNLRTADFLTEVTRGNIPGYSAINKFGHNPEVTTGTDPEDVWHGGGLYAFYPTVAQSMEIISTNDEDGGAGGDTGALSVTVLGLDSNWDEISETVILNGTTAVNLANDYIRMFRAFVVSAGSTSTNLGDITAQIQGGGTVAMFIAIDDGQTQQAIYTIPAGRSAMFIKGYVAISKAGGAQAASAEFRWRTKTNNGSNGCWQTKGQMETISTGNNSWQYKYGIPVGMIPERTDIRIECTEVSATLGVVGGFDLLVIDD